MNSLLSNSPLSNVDNVVLSGNVSTRNGTGDGSVGAAWRRTTSDRNWFEVDAKLGSNASSSATYFHRLTAKTFVNMSGNKKNDTEIVYGSSFLNIPHPLNLGFHIFHTLSTSIFNLDCGQKSTKFYPN